MASKERRCGQLTVRSSKYPKARASASDARDQRGVLSKRMKGFEPSTFAMARRRSSQLSYIRASGHSSPRAARALSGAATCREACVSL
jgi:hypothetical protein